MKKFLIFSVILFSSLFCFDNVKAAISNNDLGTLNILTDLEDKIFDDFSNINYNFIEKDNARNTILTRMINDSNSSSIEEFKENYFYYIATYDSDTTGIGSYVRGAYFSKSSDVINDISFYNNSSSNDWVAVIITTHSISSTQYYNIYIYNSLTNEYIENSSVLSSLINYNSNVYYDNMRYIISNSYKKYTLGGYRSTDFSKKAIYIETNSNFYLSKNSTSTRQYAITKVIFDNDESTSINLGEAIIENGRYKINPTINFTNLEKEYNSNNEIISESVDVILNNFDPTKYIPQYSTSLNPDWISMSNINYENFNYKTNVNETLYVRLIDLEKYYESADSGQELVIDVIASNSMHFTQIVEQLPYIKYKISYPDNCKYLHDLKYYNSCVLVKANIENMNFNKYKIYITTSTSPISLENLISVDTTDWGSHYANVFSNSYSQDTYIGFKIIDITKNEVAYYKQIYANGVRQFTELGLTIDFRTRYFDSVNKGKYVRLFLSILNDNNYTYYYSLDEGVNYNQINNIKFIDNRNLIKEGFIDITRNGKVLIKALNSNNEVVKMFETIINYDELNFKVDNLFDYLNEYKNNTDNPLGVGAQAYNTIRNSPIGNYILIIIVSSIIILFVKSVKR